jgi:hypothetical protein
MVCLACPRVWKQARSTHSHMTRPEKGFGDGIIVTVARAAHAHRDADLRQHGSRLHHWSIAIPDPNAHSIPADGCRPSSAIRKAVSISVSCLQSPPSPIRSPAVRQIQQIRGHACSGLTFRRGRPMMPMASRQSLLSHQTSHPFAGASDTLGPQFGMNAGTAIDLPTGLIRFLKRRGKLAVFSLMLTHWTFHPGIVAAQRHPKRVDIRPLTGKSSRASSTTWYLIAGRARRWTRFF